MQLSRPVEALQRHLCDLSGIADDVQSYLTAALLAMCRSYPTGLLDLPLLCISAPLPPSRPLQAAALQLQRDTLELLANLMDLDRFDLLLQILTRQLQARPSSPMSQHIVVFATEVLDAIDGERSVLTCRCRQHANSAARKDL